MKGVASPEPPKRRTVRRVSKPAMEKRRRERINHSLETLRLLMLENIDDERLKNPKVEKAEILESVVQFLKTESEVRKSQRAMKRVLSRQQASSHRNYQEGMRSCLLRVSHFIASKAQESEGGAAAALQLPEPHLPSAEHLQRVLLPSPPPAAAGAHVADPAALSPQHLSHFHRPFLSPVGAPRCGTSAQLCAGPAFAHTAEAVWRPWPQ